MFEGSALSPCPRASGMRRLDKYILSIGIHTLCRSLAGSTSALTLLFGLFAVEYQPVGGRGVYLQPRLL